MNDRPTLPAAILGGAVIAGLGLCGYFIGHGLLKARSSERFVTVKGLAEREVKADLVIWPIVLTVTADDLTTLQSRADDSARKIRAFLEHDFKGEPISVSAPRVQDRQAQGTVREQGVALSRYVAEATLTLRTGNVDGVRAAVQRSGELVKDGVAIVQNYDARTEYLFTGLEQVKPEMIAAATKDARRAAEQFASDSGSRVGAIRHAQQGYFTVEDRDPFSPEFKRVRVVTTVEFFLADQ